MSELHCPVVAMKVSDEARMSFLPQMFPRCFMNGENAVYGFMDKFCEAYNGGYWEFFTLSNGGFFMSPNLGDKVELSIELNGFDGELSSQAAGIVVSLYALCLMAESSRNDAVIENYHLLRDYALDHPESGKILRAID